MIINKTVKFMEYDIEFSEKLEDHLVESILEISNIKCDEAGLIDFKTFLNHLDLTTLGKLLRAIKSFPNKQYTIREIVDLIKKRRIKISTRDNIRYSVQNEKKDFVDEIYKNKEHPIQKAKEKHIVAILEECKADRNEKEQEALRLLESLLKNLSPKVIELTYNYITNEVNEAWEQDKVKTYTSYEVLQIINKFTNILDN